MLNVDWIENQTLFEANVLKTTLFFTAITLAAPPCRLTPAKARICFAAALVLTRCFHRMRRSHRSGIAAAKRRAAAFFLLKHSASLRNRRSMPKTSILGCKRRSSRAAFLVISVLQRFDQKDLGQSKESSFDQTTSRPVAEKATFFLLL